MVRRYSFQKTFAKCFPFCILGIDDPTGEIAAEMTDKYLGYADMGNLTSMTPGLTDVRTWFKM